jgi:cytochrome d ubiquinol oxidase subunit II
MAPTLSRGLVGAALPLVVVAAAAGVTTLVLLYRRSLSVARITAAAAVGSVVAAPSEVGGEVTGVDVGD